MKFKLVPILFLMLQATWCVGATPQKSNLVELGVVGGFPLGLGAQVGLHRLAGTPVFLRAAGGYFVLGGAVEGEAGYFFDSEGTYKQYFSVGGGHYSMVLPIFPLVLAVQAGSYLGAQYGVLLWDLVTLSVGPTCFSSTSRGTALIFLPTSSSFTDLLPYGKVGVSVYL